MHLRLKNMRGDTIVEVLICMAIVGFGLGTAYGTARRSLGGVRIAEERAQALKLAEQQIERLKQYIATNGAASFAQFPPGGATCILSYAPAGGALRLLTSLPGQAIVSTPEDPRCALDQNGNFDYNDGSNVANVDNTYPYRAAFAYDQNKHEFYVFAGRYTASGGGGVNTEGFDVITLQYRIHP